MASGKRPPSGTPGERRRRAAPTIDLKATELASEPVAAPPEPDPAAAASTPSLVAKPPQVASPVNESPPTPSPEPPRDEPAASEPPPPPPSSGQGNSGLPPDGPWRLIAAGAAGAAVVLLCGTVVWLVSPRPTDAVAALSPRIAEIENQLRALAARPVPQGIDPKAIGELSSRLAKLETAAASRPAAGDAALGGRVAALEKSIKPLSDSLAALARRADETDTALRDVRGRTDATDAGLTELRSVSRIASGDHAEIEKLGARIATLEKANRAIADELAKRTEAAGDRPVRLALAAAALQSSMERGESYERELGAVKAAEGNRAALSAVEPFAATGIPSAAALGRELAALMPALRNVAGKPSREGGFLDRLQANAEKLVRVRPLEEVKGEDVDAILTRVEARAAQSDIAGALAELAKLPAAVRAPASDWIARARLRNQAVEAGRKLADDALSALSGNP